MTGDSADLDAQAYCEEKECIGRQEAICLARRAGLTDGLTGIKAGLMIRTRGEAALHEDGSPVDESELPEIVPGTFWFVWNLTEDKGIDGRGGESVMIHAETGDAEELHGWMLIH